MADTGVTFHKGDADSLLVTLQELLSRPDEAKQLGRLARDRVATEYDWGVVVRKTLELYGGALE